MSVVVDLKSGPILLYQAIQTIECLRKERDALKADAERYRKVEAWVKEYHLNLVWQGPDARVGFEVLYGPTFDAAVDALPEPEGK